MNEMNTGGAKFSKNYDGSRKRAQKSINLSKVRNTRVKYAMRRSGSECANSWQVEACFAKC